MDWFLRRRFLLMLVALALLLLVYPVLHDLVGGDLVFGLLATPLFLAGYLVVLPDRRFRLLAVLLGLPALAGLWTGYALGEHWPAPLTPLLHALAALFLGCMAVWIVVFVYQRPAVTADDVCGAFCAYLLLGLAFGHLYSLMESAAPGSFQGSPEVTQQLRDHKQRRYLLTYFSLVTMTTLGYGDVTPASGAARGLAAVEAVLGQIYVAFLVAELVGRRVGQPPAPPPAPEG